MIFREFATGAGRITLDISVSRRPTPSATYVFADSERAELARLTTYGVDTMQALIFCLTAAGDYVKEYLPSASFAETGVSGLPVTVFDSATSWKAEMSLPP